MGGCTATGELNTSKFSQPMIVIGLYIALASLVCGLLMLVDLIRGVRQRKPWLPCKYFSLNAITLTLIGVAVKIPTDINNSMPSHLDQLSKLSGTTFMCAIMAFVFPSLGPLKGAELLSNVSALAVLVVTVIVDVSIQMSTGVIYTFIPEHIATLILMFIQVISIISIALAVPGAKVDLEAQFEMKRRSISSSSSTSRDSVDLSPFQIEVKKKIWLVAYNGNPQFVVGRMSPSMNISFASYVTFLLLLEATIRSFKSSSTPKFYEGNSDYRWTIRLVVMAQLVVAFLAFFSIGPRMFYVQGTLSRSKMSDVNPAKGYFVYQLKKFRHDRLSFKSIFINWPLDAIIWIQSLFFRRRSCYNPLQYLLLRLFLSDRQDQPSTTRLEDINLDELKECVNLEVWWKRRPWR